MIIFPIILVGGSGTRLWPLSVEERPKQFIPLASDCSMLEDTLRRVSDPERFAAPVIVAGERHLALLADIIAKAGLSSPTILLEPQARNTAAAIALAACWLRKIHGDVLMLVMPSDHVIGNEAQFHKRIDDAVLAAEAGHLVTFGIQPDHPATGYGYIERGGPVEGVNLYKVESFVEKPPLAVAEAYFADGRHSWNAGIFLFSVSHFLEELNLYAPEVAIPIGHAMEAADHNGDIVRPERTRFLESADISIDHAVMEKTRRAVVAPVSIGWSDIGSWDALWSIRAKDEFGNSRTGPSVALDCHNNLIFVDGGPPVAVLGVTDSVIVSTAQAVLVLPRNRSQDVKTLFEAHKRLAGRR